MTTSTGEAESDEEADDFSTPPQQPACTYKRPQIVDAVLRALRNPRMVALDVDLTRCGVVVGDVGAAVLADALASPRFKIIALSLPGSYLFSFTEF
jgi:hypothetical protein